MIIGLDVGFSAVKAISESNQTVIFPSVVGTPVPERTYSLGRENGLAIKLNGGDMFTLVGATALRHSQYKAGRRDSSWVMSPEWRTLFATALSEFSVAPYQSFQAVIGLPVYDWLRYATELRSVVRGKLAFCRRGREPQVADVTHCLVITQPYGSLLNQALDDTGQVLDNVWASGLAAIVDLGGNTMNLLVVDALDEIGRWTLSDEFGLLHALDDVRDSLRSKFARFSPETHEVAEWLAAGSFRYRGEDIAIWDYAKDYLEPLITMAMTRVNEAWPESSRFDAVLLTGGGSAAIGKYIKSRMTEFANVRIADDPRWANVNGYLKLARQVYG